MPDSLKHKTLKGTLWSALERFSVQAVSFIVMIIMANLLTPTDYGLVGMLTIFIAVSQSLVDSGFSQALIRKQTRTEIDNSTVFYFNIAIGLILYLILFFCAPLIAQFYKEQLLIPITRVISLSIIINSLVVVQRALLIARIDFKTQAKASLTAAIVSGIVGIYLAYSKIGVWSIVIYQLLNLGINCSFLWILARWRPKLIFSWKVFKEMFNFGSKLALTGIINTIYNNILIVIIGKLFKPADLGYYTRAHQFADFPSATGTTILQKVTYPILCTIQEDDDRLRIIYRKFLRLSAYVIFPVMFGMAALSEPFIKVFLNENWLYTAKLLPIICMSMMWYPIHAINLNLLQVKGKTTKILKLEILKKIIGISIIASTMWLGLIALCWGMVINSLLALIINTHYTGKYLGIGLAIQIKDLIPTLIYSVSMYFIILCISQLFKYALAQLLLCSLIGIVYYIFISKITSSKDFNELTSLIKHKNENT